MEDLLMTQADRLTRKNEFGKAIRLYRQIQKRDGRNDEAAAAELFASSILAMQNKKLHRFEQINQKIGDYFSAAGRAGERALTASVTYYLAMGDQTKLFLQVRELESRELTPEGHLVLADMHHKLLRNLRKDTDWREKTEAHLAAAEQSGIDRIVSNAGMQRLEMMIEDGQTEGYEELYSRTESKASGELKLRLVLNRAQYYLSAGNKEEAARTVQKISEECSRDAQLAEEAAILFFDYEEYQEALRLSRMAVRQKSKSFKPYMICGASLLMLGEDMIKMPEASKMFRKSLSLDSSPMNAMSFAGLGSYYSRTKKPGLAREYFDKVIDEYQMPTVYILNQRAELRIGVKDYAGAEADSLHSLEMADNLVGHFNYVYAKLLSETKCVESVRILLFKHILDGLREAKELDDKESVNNGLWLADLVLDMPYAESKLKMLEQLTELMPKEEYFLRMLAQAYQSERRLDESEAVYNKLSEDEEGKAYGLLYLKVMREPENKAYRKEHFDYCYKNMGKNLFYARNVMEAELYGTGVRQIDMNTAKYYAKTLSVPAFKSGYSCLLTLIGRYYDLAGSRAEADNCFAAAYKIAAAKRGDYCDCALGYYAYSLYIKSTEVKDGVRTVVNAPLAKRAFRIVLDAADGFGERCNTNLIQLYLYFTRKGYEGFNIARAAELYRKSVKYAVYATSLHCAAAAFFEYCGDGAEAVKCMVRAEQSQGADSQRARDHLKEITEGKQKDIFPLLDNA